MSLPDLNAMDEHQVRQHLARWQQEHLLRWWNELDPGQRDQLARQIAGVDFALLRQLHADGPSAKPSGDLAGRIHPPSVIGLPEEFEDLEREQHAQEVGERALRAGQVAVVIVAGGQGTRLGFEGPKGTFPIGPISNKSLFQILVEKIVAVARRYETELPLYLMTSPDNDEATRRYFADHAYFGMDPASVVFFTQGTMPAVDAQTGQLLLADKSTLALSPNGHGGVLQTLHEGGHLREMRRRGIQHLYYCQVDNPLVKIADPVFLGYHLQAGAEMSLKVVAKRAPEERVGVVVQVDQTLQLIEYSDLPSELAAQRTAAGELAIRAGSIGVHLFALTFLERLASTGQMLPYHSARKVVPFLDETGATVRPAEPNAVKFEMFVFDALPLARKAVIMETSRREEFEPLKNAEGDNSPVTVRQAMADLFADWLGTAGVNVSRRPNGAAAVAIEISPLYALDAEELRDQVSHLETVTEPLYLDGRIPPRNRNDPHE